MHKTNIKYQIMKTWPHSDNYQHVYESIVLQFIQSYQLREEKTFDKSSSETGKKILMALIIWVKMESEIHFLIHYAYKSKTIQMKVPIHVMIR